MTDELVKHLTEYVLAHEPNLGDGNSVLTLLYEAYSEVNTMENTQIKADFNELYRQMNGMELREMDKIIYPVCTLCRDYQQSGFMEGVKLGVMLGAELPE